MRPRLLTFAGVVALVGAATLFVVLVPYGGAQFTPVWTTAVLGLLAGGSALLSASSSASSSATARRAYSQQLYELARAVHADLTTGEVAEARDRLGTIVRVRRVLWSSPWAPSSTAVGEMGLAYRRLPGTLGDARQDWFTLLWCFQRVHAALVLLAQTPPEVVAKGQQAPWDFLAGLVQSQVRFLNDDAADIRAALEEWSCLDRPQPKSRLVDDGESKEAFRDLVHVLLDVTPGRWARAISTEQPEPLYALLMDAPEQPLRELSKDQFDALHCAVALNDGARQQDRAAFVKRLCKEASVDGVSKAERERLRNWAEVLGKTVPGPAKPTPERGA